MKKRKIILFLGAISMSLAAAFPAFAGWQQDQIGWKYEADGIFSSEEWKKIDSTWYYFGQDGYMDTGWIVNNEHRYYINSDGAMLTGEQVIDGKVYTFSRDGQLLMEGVHRDGMEDDLLAEAVVNTKEHWNDILYSLSLVNQEREKVGAAPLVIDYDLSIIATYRAAHMNKYNYFSHYYNDKPVCKHDVTTYTGKNSLLKENIWLYGNTTNPNNGIINRSTSKEIIQMAHNDYINSSGHYANIIGTDSTKMGIGIYKNQVGTRDYVTMLFNKLQ
jgi:glucan-binding YG repeat protein